MPANFTRRLDLFRDAGFPDPEGAVRELTAALAGKVPKAGGKDLAAVDALTTALAEARQGLVLPLELTRLALLVPELLFERQGDLATLLWLAGKEHAGTLPLGPFMLGPSGLLPPGAAPKKMASALLVDVEFGTNSSTRRKGRATASFASASPTPSSSSCSSYFEARPGGLTILDLGAGIGNDALGFLGSAKVERYFAADLSADELAKA